jgi:SAM-dependent methyltransferase
LRGVIIKSNKIINKIYHNRFTGRLFHTSVYCLRRELGDCNSVLDLGCGSDSPIKYCNVYQSVGVDGFPSSVKDSKNKRIHNQYVLSDLRNLNFKPTSFDAVILIEVIEHLPKKEGILLLEKVETWARKKVIVSSPNNYFAQPDINGNPYFRHISGWTIEKMRARGYKAHGMAGLKFLRKESMEKKRDDNDVFSTIKFRPRVFWLIVSELIQVIVYYFPNMAFEVFYVKQIKGDA